MDSETTVLDVLMKGLAALALLDQATEGTEMRGLVYAAGTLVGQVVDQLNMMAEEAEEEVN